MTSAFVARGAEIVDASAIAVNASEIGASVTAVDASAIDASVTGASATAEACLSAAHALATVVNATVTAAYDAVIESTDAREIETYDVRGTVENAAATASAT